MMLVTGVLTLFLTIMAKQLILDSLSSKPDYWQQRLEITAEELKRLVAIVSAQS